MLQENDRKMLEQIVNDNVEILKVAKNESKVYKQIWKFQNEHDFFYGHTVGRIEGTAIGIFLQRDNKRLSFDDLNEIKEIIELRSKEIRELIYR